MEGGRGDIEGDSPSSMLLFATPAGFERVCAEAGEPARGSALPPPPEKAPDMERLMTVSARYGIDIPGPPQP